MYIQSTIVIAVIILGKITAYEKDPTTTRAEIEAKEAVERIRFFINPPAGDVRKNFSALKKIASALDKKYQAVASVAPGGGAAAP